MTLSVLDTDSDGFGPAARCAGPEYGSDYFICYTSGNARIAQVDTEAETITMLGAGNTDVVSETISEDGGVSLIPGTDYGLIAYEVDGLPCCDTDCTIYAKIIEPATSGTTVQAHTADSEDFSYYDGGGQTAFANAPSSSIVEIFVQALSDTLGLIVWSITSTPPSEKYGMYAVVDISGTTVTVNTPGYIVELSEFEDTHTWGYVPLAMKRISDTEALLIYRMSPDDNDDEVWIAKITVSGSTVSLSNQTLIHQEPDVSTAGLDAFTCQDSCIGVNPNAGEYLAAIYNTAGYGESWWFRTDDDASVGALTHKDEYPYPCPSAPMADNQFLTATKDENGTNDLEVQVATIESDDSITLESSPSPITLTGVSTIPRDVYVVGAGYSVVFGNTEAFLIGGVEITEAPDIEPSVDYDEFYYGIESLDKMCDLSFGVKPKGMAINPDTKDVVVVSDTAQATMSERMLKDESYATANDFSDGLGIDEDIDAVEYI
jgi:hypothetical protein